MKAKLKLSQLFFIIGLFLLVFAPTSASAHDNLGADELAVANWMLVAALVVLVMGVLAGIWAARSGQFTNIEESKYQMLENADDYDAVMAAARELDRLKEATQKPERLKVAERKSAKPADHIAQI